MKGILGKKIGMTQVFTKEGKLIPVTVVEVEPNVVTQIKTVEKDGYDAIQLATDSVREGLSNKPEMGHTKKANTTPKRFLREIRGVNVSDYTLGQEIGVDIFEAGEIVDVTGTSKGKGFQGVIKRHNQTIGPKGHGSQYHRGVGSLGTLLPMHVLKGKKMPGQMGNVKRTVQNLEVVSIDTENNVILVKGNAVMTKEGAEVFAKAGIKLFGNESQTVGPLDAPMEVHLVMLGAKIVLLEGVRLGEVPIGVYLLNAAPINLGGSDGAPCRAVLMDLT